MFAIFQFTIAVVCSIWFAVNAVCTREQSYSVLSPFSSETDTSLGLQPATESNYQPATVIGMEIRTGQGQWQCSLAGKVTMVLALHCSCITSLYYIHVAVWWPKKWRWTPRLHSFLFLGTVTFPDSQLSWPYVGHVVICAWKINGQPVQCPCTFAHLDQMGPILWAHMGNPTLASLISPYGG